MKRTKSQKKSNVLLVNITRLGDMLQATPTIAGMKMENPECRITVLVEKQFAEVCKCIPNIDEILSLDLTYTVRCLAQEREGIVEAYEYISKIVDDLRSRNFDYCLNMSSSAYTALLLKLVNIERNGGWTADEEGYRVIESSWARLFATSVYHQNRQLNSLNLVDVFRCSADVEQHPHKLLINIEEDSRKYARELIASAGFTNTGPLVCIQAGASQDKRQWAPKRFITLIRELVEKHNLRVGLVGTEKELAIINPIHAGCASPNVAVFAGKTSIVQLAALLSESQLLITGDTGPMHISVAAGTPVVALFLASAYGYETGPYSEGNIVLQPVISCGPCNPNKPCARPDCHDQIDPLLVAQLAVHRLQGDFKSLPSDIAPPSSVVIYRSFFDDAGFCDLKPLAGEKLDPLVRFRRAYRHLWLDDIGEINTAEGAASGLRVYNGLQGLDEVLGYAKEGQQLIRRLIDLVRDIHAPGKALQEVNTRLTELDRLIEQKGFHYPPLGPVTRMFMFDKENLQGTEAIELASQMNTVYCDLERRTRKFGEYYQKIQ